MDYLVERGVTFSQINAISGGVISGYLVQSGNADQLREFWTKALPSHANRFRWYAGIPFNVILRAHGLVSPKFTKDLIDEWITGIAPNLSFDVVSMFDGEQHSLDEHSFEEISEYRKAVYAAVAIPAVFSPIDLFPNNGPILDAADGGIYYPLPDAEADFNVVTHHFERDIERVKGPLSALLRVWYWRQWNVLNKLQDEPGLLTPTATLPKTWDWSQDSLTYSFEHGRRVAHDNFDSIFS